MKKNVLYLSAGIMILSTLSFIMFRNIPVFAQNALTKKALHFEARMKTEDPRMVIEEYIRDETTKVAGDVTTMVQKTIIPLFFQKWLKTAQPSMEGISDNALKSQIQNILEQQKIAIESLKSRLEETTKETAKSKRKFKTFKKILLNQIEKAISVQIKELLDDPYIITDLEILIRGHHELQRIHSQQKKTMSQQIAAAQRRFMPFAQMALGQLKKR